GVLSIGLIEPNVIKAMHQVGLISSKRQSEIVYSSASKLAKKGLLKFNGKYYELTKEGEKYLRQLELRSFKLDKPRKWDKKWRMIIFDIPEKKRKVRTQIRTIFASVGLLRLQDSVWVYPYDCEDIVGLLKTDLGVGKDVLYIIVDEIENDRHLREEFGIA
ncbi:MAG: CRISPR-associated endonuclease Cas2, partial [Patescibacteria group bacterium]